MIGKIYPSEKHSYMDPVSGHQVTQLTNQGSTVTCILLTILLT